MFDLSGKLREHPMLAIAVATGLGVMIGMTVRYRRNHALPDVLILSAK